MFYLTWTDIGKESQTPHIHTEDGNHLLPHPAGGFEKGSIATHRDDIVGIEVIVLKDAVGTDVKTLVERQEVVIFLVYIDLCVVLGETGKHLLDRCRLLGLIDVAE